MRLLPLMFSCVLIGSVVPKAAAQDAPEACQPGGFAIETDSNGKTLTGKADSTFNVTFDGTYYKGNDFEDALKQNIDAWSNITGSNWKYKFAGFSTSGASQEDGMMSVVKGGLSLPGAVLAATRVSWSTISGQIIDSDIFFNQADPINTNPSKIEYDFQQIALHEMGHALGLDHNDQCTGQRTVMFPFLNTGQKAHALFPQEMNGVRFLYSGGNPPGGVAASPFVLHFTGALDGPLPPAQTTAITGLSGATWSVTSVDPWITVSPTSGTTPATLTVQVNPHLLSSFGPQIGSIVVASRGLSLAITVALDATTLPAPLFQVTPGALSFQALQGGPTPASQPVDLLGQAGLAWTAQVPASANWLRLSATSGRVPTTIFAQVSSAGIVPGIYTAAITFTVGGISQQMQVRFELAAQPRVVVSPAQVSLSEQTGRNGLFCSRVAVTGFAGSTLSWTASADQPWMTLLPASGSTPADLLVCASAGNLKPSNYSATVTVSSSAPASQQAVAVAFMVTSVVGAPAVVDGATLSRQAGVAAGEILSLFAPNLASGTATASGFPLPTQLAGTSVLIGGVPAPLLYVSPTQINLIAPSILSGSVGGTTPVVVYNGNLASPPAQINVVKCAPSIFSVTGVGAATADVTHNDGTLVTRAAPLAPGEAVSIYLTGLGPKTPTVADGAAAPAKPLATAAGNVHVRFDGQEAPVIFAGAAPNFAGLDVVVVTVPAALSSQSPRITVQVDDVTSDSIPAANF